jgi:hypothetical protein
MSVGCWPLCCAGLSEETDVLCGLQTRMRITDSARCGQVATLRYHFSPRQRQRMRSKLKRRNRNDRGQALVEFALVAPILILLVLGMVDFARAWNAYQVITDAAREAARIAVIDNPATMEADVSTAITDALGRSGLNADQATITVTGFRSGRGTPATVRVEYDYRLGWIGKLLAFAAGDELVTLRSEIVMRNE